MFPASVTVCNVTSFVTYSTTALLQGYKTVLVGAKVISWLLFAIISAVEGTAVCTALSTYILTAF